MSQNRRSDDVDNGSRRNKESEHESTTVSASRSLEGEEVLLIPASQHVIARIRETLVPSPNSQFEHSNLGSQTHSSGSEDGSGPVSASALMKAIEEKVIHTVQHSITPAIEDLCRRVAKVEVEVEKLRNYGIGMHSPTKSLELQFRDKISLPVCTGSHIEGEGHKPLELDLLDSETRQIVDSGPEASAEFEVFLLQGDTEQNVVGECKGKNSLLKGNTNLKLNKGIGSLGGISFKHKKNWMKKCQLRLAARIVDPSIGTRVKEAKTELFTLNDKRSTLNEKHDCPSLSDPVWRLKNIDKRGVYYGKLKEREITTVQKFLTEYNLNPRRLQDILGSRILEETVANAMKCKLDDSSFQCSPSSRQAEGDVVGQLPGVRSEGVPVDQLHETERAGAKNSVGCDSSDLSNAQRSSQLHRPESSSGHNGGNYHMINGTDSTQPNYSLLDTISSSNTDFVGPHNGTSEIIDGSDTNRLHSSNPGVIENDIFQPGAPSMESFPLYSPFNPHDFGFQYPNLQFDEVD